MKLMSTCVVLAAVALPTLAAAQATDQPAGKRKGSATVYVTDTAGRETKGKLLSWVGSEIVVDTGTTTKTFKPGEAVRLDGNGDSLKNGALIGAAAGSLFGWLNSSYCSCAAPGKVAIAASSAGLYALLGVGIDALIPGRRVLWSAGPRQNARSGLTFQLSPERHSAFLGWRIK
jgi:hypothetical protein